MLCAHNTDLASAWPSPPMSARESSENVAKLCSTARYAVPHLPEIPEASELGKPCYNLVPNGVCYRGGSTVLVTAYLYSLCILHADSSEIGSTPYPSCATSSTSGIAKHNIL